MAHYKLILEEDDAEDFSLLAIHCSEEAYKMGFLLNKYLGLQLERWHVDLDLSSNGLDLMFPIFEFEDKRKYTTFHLVANVCSSKIATLQSSGGLFDDSTNEKTVITYLLPEFKNVDFFLKISSEDQRDSLKQLVRSINEIPQVISAYSIDTETIKTKNNLIFY